MQQQSLGGLREMPAKPLVMVGFGTRPEAIKMAPVIEALRRTGRCRVETVHTGQHEQLADQVFRVFRISVNHGFDIMTADQSVGQVLAHTIERADRLFRRRRPQALLVQGDTASAFGLGLAGHLHRLVVGHVEAGLRSHDRLAPFPEELMRTLLGQAADLHFAPTPRARGNLLQEGVPRERILVTGNTVVDALVWAARAEGLPDADKLWPTRELRVLLTMHRRESFGAPMLEALGTVRALADEYSELGVVFPVHPNPAVRRAVARTLNGHPRVRLCPPVDYLTLVSLLRSATVVLSDSGGVQEEAPSFGVPVLVLRNVTERPEGLGRGGNILVGTSRAAIRAGFRRALGWSRSSRLRRPRPSVFGDGRAGERIARALATFLAGRRMLPGRFEFRRP